MAWSINNIREFVQFLTNKNLAGGISASDLFYAWNQEQKSYQEDLLGKWENRNNGKAGGNTGLILDETILQKLSPFTLTTSLTILSAKATKPDDFIYKLALRINAARVEMIAPSQIWAVTSSVIDPPSTDDNKYYATEFDNYYSLLPTTLPTASITTVDLDYIKICPDVRWGYDTLTNGKQVYNQGLSTQPLWDDNSIIVITKRTLKTLGVHFKDNDFEKFGQSVINSGD